MLSVRRASSRSSASSAARRSRSCRRSCSATACSRSRARSASSSASPCSARSPTCRCSSRSCAAPPRPSPGLQLVPVMAGVLIASIVSGQIISRTGRYKAWPIAGTAVGVRRAALARARWTRTRARRLAALEMLVLGLGLGMVMQVLVLAVQNAVPYEQLGVATSGATLFRSIGGSLGTAILGAIFTQPAGRVARPRRGAGPTSARSTRRPLERLPTAARDASSPRSPTRSASSSSSRPASWRSRSCSPGCSRSGRCARRSPPRGLQAFAAPDDPDSVRTVASALSRIVGREGASRVRPPHDRRAQGSTSRRSRAGCWCARRPTARSTSRT